MKTKDQKLTERLCNFGVAKTMVTDFAKQKCFCVLTFHNLLFELFKNFN